MPIIFIHRSSCQRVRKLPAVSGRCIYEVGNSISLKMENGELTLTYILSLIPIPLPPMASPASTGSHRWLVKGVVDLLTKYRVAQQINYV